jgi:hypothetical protein
LEKRNPITLQREGEGGMEGGEYASLLKVQLLLLVLKSAFELFSMNDVFQFSLCFILLLPIIISVRPGLSHRQLNINLGKNQSKCYQKLRGVTIQAFISNHMSNFYHLF